MELTIRPSRENQTETLKLTNDYLVTHESYTKLWNKFISYKHKHNSKPIFICKFLEPLVVQFQPHKKYKSKWRTYIFCRKLIWKSYLSGRTQMVICGDTRTPWVLVKYECCQVSPTTFEAWPPPSHREISLFCLSFQCLKPWHTGSPGQHAYLLRTCY